MWRAKQVVCACSRRAAKQSRSKGGERSVRHTLNTICVFSNSSLICGRKGAALLLAPSSSSSSSSSSSNKGVGPIDHCSQVVT